ncbi:methyl-accepting chemotaxis protein [Paenibacillus sp. YYML68]|uniref:methyl-accepting chemotaxis protein n=1 Tax=Paenibacillus sp. YYML68 TaxID=2909250 RepID=UPI002491A566|nr:methyl-accepting chemotaxis protein [Paenibacillus sp. YYML68]
MTWIRTLLKPSSSLMNRLQYGKKFLVITLLFLSALSFMMYNAVKEIQADRQFAEKERLGVRYNEGLLKVMLQFQQHRGLANGYLNGDPSLETAMKEKASQADEAIKQMETLEAELGAQLDTTAGWLAVKDKWMKLRDGTASMTAAQSFEVHSGLVDDTIHLIKHAADMSNLTLDPDLDSYYLMDLTVNNLPTLMEKLGQARGKGTGIAASQKLTPEQKLELLIFTDSIRTNSADVNKKAGIVFKHNASIRADLHPLATGTVGAADEFVKTLDTKLLNAETINIAPAELFEQGTKAIEGTSAMYVKSAEKLDLLLQQRVQRLTDKLNTVLITNIVIVLLACYMFTGFYMSVKGTISQLRRAARTMAGGDLTVDASLTTRDELREVGEAFTTMAQQMSRMLQRNKELADRVAASSTDLTAVAEQTSRTTEQIAEAMQQIAAGSELQVRSSEETANAMNEMAIGIQRIAENASTVSEASMDTTKLARNGSESVQRAVEQMQTVRDKALLTAGTMKVLSDKSDEIGTIISAISDITAQTNLLALNASIEAARAGEHGRGFAVVAGEIRKLADQSNTSAAMIQTLVADIQASAHEAKISMDAGVQEAELGSQVIMETNEAFGAIRASIEQVTEQIQEISAASEQMSAGSEQITASVDEMLQIATRTMSQTQTVYASTEEQTASVEEITASAETLSATAVQLKEELQKFKTKA